MEKYEKIDILESLANFFIIKFKIKIVLIIKYINKILLAIDGQSESLYNTNYFKISNEIITNCDLCMDFSFSHLLGE